MTAHVKPRPVVAFFVFCLTASAAIAQPATQPLEIGSVAQKQALQDRVRTMARELVGGVIDVQLQQLRENGLETLAIYGELAEMRKHVDQLVARQMPGVLEVLSRLAETPAEQREPLLLAARQKSRQVLVGLLVERQAVLRRLRIAEIAAQARRVIGLQTAALAATEKLPAEPAPRREAGTLRVIEDQADVGAVYRGLKEMLRDAAGWAGPVGAEAAEGLRLLEAGQVDAELANAESRLRASRLAEAPTSQQAVIRGLEPLLARIERAQGLDEPDMAAAEQALRDLIQEQEQLHKETAEANLAQPEADKLVNRQAEIAKKLKPFVEAQNSPPEMKQELQRAEAAAKEAAARMFQQKREEALAEQLKAIESLKRAAQHAAELPAAKAKAEQIEASKLDKARDELKEILHQQQKASADAAEKPHEAKRQEEQVANRLAEVPQKHPLPEEVKKRVDEAKKAVDEAARRMEQPRAERQQAARQAEQAIERAVAQAEAAANQARLRELAEKAKPAEQAAKTNPQAEAEQKKAAEELKRLLAEMRKTLEEARQAVEQEIGDRMDSAAKRAERLAQAEEKVAQAAAEQQQAAGRPQAAEAAKMARQVERAAEAQAEAAKSAEKHADLARALAKLAAEAKPAPLAEALREAENKARQAAEEMARGKEGQAEQAAAREALQKAQQLARAQAAEARKAPPGKPDAQAQQRVTQAAAEAEKLAQADAPPAAGTLGKAQAESAEAARHAGEGKTEPAAKSQQATAEMLDQAAAQLAEAQRRLAQQSPPEFARQSQRAQELTHKAMPADPEATQALQRAENQAREAADQQMPAPAQMTDADHKVGQALEEAAASLRARERQLGQPAQSRAKPSMLARAKAKTDRTSQQPPTELSETGRRMEDDALEANSSADGGKSAARALSNDPWLAKLPPEVRSAIRVNSQRTAPRGYEERMQKYFRNIE